MNIYYWKKSYTQWHLRCLIKDKRKEWLTLREIKDILNIWSTATVHKWVNSDTIEDKSSAPKNPNRKYEFHELYYLYAYKKYSKLPLDNIIDLLEEKNWITFKRSSASYYLNKWKLTKKFKPKREYSKFKDYDVWYLHIDITYGPKIDGKKYYIYVAIDRKTRLLYLEVHTDKKAETAANFLKNAIDFFPFEIDYILTDNWKEFTLKNHKWKYDLQWAFDKICEEFNIEHRLTNPYSPWTNWMVEKVNDTIKSGTLKKVEYGDANSMINDLNGFMVHYNLERRHSGIYSEIRKKTPYEALEHYYEIMPEKFKETPFEFREKLLKFNPD